MTASLPPLSFQNWSILFLASVEGPIIFSKPLLIFVSISVAWSLSPMICSHDVAQPDCTDSFMVSNNCVTVLTSVAAALALLANSTIDFA